MSIALPTIQRSLHFTEVDRQWVVTAYALAFGSLLLLGGRLADLLGRKETLLVGLVGFAGVSAVGGAKWDSSDPWVRVSAADRRAGGGAFGPGAGAPPVSHRAPRGRRWRASPAAFRASAGRPPARCLSPCSARAAI
jgi:MFS family permease